MSLRDEIIHVLKNNYDNGEVFTDLILSKLSYDFNLDNSYFIDVDLLVDQEIFDIQMN